MIYVINDRTKEFFIARVHDTYGMGYDWTPVSYGGPEDSLNLNDEYTEIECPKLPEEELNRLLCIFRRYVITRLNNSTDEFTVKINLIKRYRELTGEGFIEAKRYIDANMNNYEDYFYKCIENINKMRNDPIINYDKIVDDLVELSLLHQDKDPADLKVVLINYLKGLSLVSSRSLAIKFAKESESLHDSPNSFIYSVLNFIEYELGEDTTKLVKDKFNSIFDRLYSK